MNTPLRTATIAATLTLALCAAAGAATIRLVPLSAPAIGASVTNTCAAPFAAAAVTAAAPADLPTIAAEQHVTGITAVRIALDARGRLAKQSVLASSGDRWLDEAALAAARQSRYRPEVRDCAPVGGSYAFVVDFTR